MKQIIATIYLYKGENKRKTPFKNNYRPLFNFIKETKTSGNIKLLNNKSEFQPGEKNDVLIQFINTEFLGKDFKIGKKFTFGEGKEILGEGKILEILK
ncbi:translation elongation factor Tu [Aquimarina agarilytica]|uniref:translation elongation factor Tu n=1 Tax=Aquimarina agarilytica TaxID=1087449 RepID=UPI0002887BC7|nr:translation elongation factor Tu [Aquimarina agarilytica]